MLSLEARAETARRFGADDDQIIRDHLISHLLVGLADTAGDAVVFFGGTALSRTHLPAGRLSEDIDLYASGDRRGIVPGLNDRWPRSVRREYPRLAWRPGLDEAREVEPASLVSESGAVVRVQLLGADSTYRRWPTESRPIAPRYSDVPAIELTVPTLPAFVAMKASAWRDRHAARDLFDLAGLAEQGAIDDEAVALLHDITRTPLVGAELEHVPKNLSWREQLAHQCRLELSSEEALCKVREAWAQAADW